MKMKAAGITSFPTSKADIVPLLIWFVVIFITWVFMHGADHYLELTPEALGKYFQLRWILIIHITAGGGALVTGIIQFWPKLRNYSWRLHRMVGFLYLLSILVSSICALTLAFTTAYEVNWANAFTLQIWASVWITSSFIAYYAGVRKKFNLHREWMIRSYIVTAAFLISGLMLKIPYIQQLGPYEEISTPLFGMGWAVPLYVYEIIRSQYFLKGPNKNVNT